MSTLAISGGTPIRTTMLPYAHHEVSEADVAAVTAILRDGMLTTGPMVPALEVAFAKAVGSKYAVAFNSGTSALHGATFAIGVERDDEVIVPNVTYIATAYAALYEGATPVIADVDAEMLIDPRWLGRCFSHNTRAVVTMDYGGNPCDYPYLRQLCHDRGVYLIADSCHSLGASLEGKPIGSWADLTVFSLHPIKTITSCEGGMVTTDSAVFAERMRLLRNCGRTTTYESHFLGYNYRMSDVHAALGLSQLQTVGERIERRHKLALRYAREFDVLRKISPLVDAREFDEGEHAWHLYSIRLPHGKRDWAFDALRAEGIGVQIHYLPLHRQPYLAKHSRRLEQYRQWPDDVLTLPLFPSMTEQDQDDVIAAVRKLDEALGEGK